MAVTITWDGSVTTPNYNEYYCRVSERIFTRAELTGAVAVFGGVEYTNTHLIANGDEALNVTNPSEGFWLRVTDSLYSGPILLSGKAGLWYPPGGFGSVVEILADGTYFIRRYVDTNLKYTESLYLPNAASDPIPVNPAPTLDPTALLMGWQVGNWVARQRGNKTEQPEEDESGGGTEDEPGTVSGVWVFDNVISAWPEKNIGQNVNYTSAGYQRIYLNVFPEYGNEVQYHDPVKYYVYAYRSGAWKDQAYRTVDFGTEPQTVSPEFYKWLTANAVKQ